MPPRRRAVARLMPLTLAASLACGGDGATEGNGSATASGSIAALALDRDDATIAATGSRLPLVATPTDAAGRTVTGANLMWLSSSPSVAVVNADGVVSSIAPGRATISVTATTGTGSQASTRTATSIITVVPGIAGATTLNYPSPTLALGQSIAYEVWRFEPSGLGERLALAWSSTGEGVVQVSAGGVATATGKGTAVVRGSAGSETYSSDVRVVAFAAVVPSGEEVCAFTAEGELFCAGRLYGPRARSAHAGLAVRQLEGFGGNGESGFCAVADDGRGYCWGTNTQGQLGVGDLQPRTSPALIAGNHQWEAISPTAYNPGRGLSTCGLRVDGRILCWGSGTSGQLGHGANANSTVPVPVAGDIAFVQVAGGGAYNCGLTAQGVAHCWGDNEFGWLGDGRAPESSSVPRQVNANTPFLFLSRGTDWMCGVTATGASQCWGYMTARGVNAGTHACNATANRCSFSPAPLNGPARFVSLVGGFFGMCGITTQDQVACFGLNQFERFGIPAAQTPSGAQCFNTVWGCLPDPTPGPAGFVRVSTAGFTTCGIATNGEARCWGGNQHRQLTEPGIASHTFAPTLFAVDPSQ